MTDKETHPLEPFLPPHARVLMCGTFPPPSRRWSMNFYYPNFINDMWRIFGIALHDDKDYYVVAGEKRFNEKLLREEMWNLGLALSDTGREVVRTKGNAADKFLEIREPIDLRGMLSRLPQCRAVVTTGTLAAEVIAEITGTEVPKAGECVVTEFDCGDGELRPLHIWRMPSSSRAYPLKLELKAAAYARMLRTEFP